MDIINLYQYITTFYLINITSKNIAINTGRLWRRPVLGHSEIVCTVAILDVQGDTDISLCRERALARRRVLGSGRMRSVTQRAFTLLNAPQGVVSKKPSCRQEVLWLWNMLPEKFSTITDLNHFRNQIAVWSDPEFTCTFCSANTDSCFVQFSVSCTVYFYMLLTCFVLCVCLILYCLSVNLF